MTEHARLIVVSGRTVGRTWQVNEELVIGRSSECDVVIDDSDVSRRHAILNRDGKTAFQIEDLGSRNGILLNGKRVTRARLRFGDKFRIGTQQVFMLMPYDPIEEELLRRKRLETLGRLTAGVTHDLNNMLGAITAALSFLLELPADQRASPDADDCFDDMNVAVTRAADLAARLLTFTRSATGHASIDVTAICHEAVKLARRTFDGTIHITEDVAPELRVDGNEAQLHQVLMNLLVNARDAISEKGQGTITVRASSAPADRSILIHIEDDGCGMDEATRDHIFRAFYTTKRQGAGFGLGLATVADIAHAHGGNIEVTSTVGEGTTFVVTLPASVRKPNSRKPHTTLLPPRSDTDARGKRVLLVDDEPVMQRSLKRILKRVGFNVSVAGDGETALRLANEQPPDIVVLDLDLPGMRGEDVLANLLKKQPDLPIVCVTGHHRSEREKSVCDLGANAFLGKPFSADELIMAMFKSLGSVNDPWEVTTQA